MGTKKATPPALQINIHHVGNITELAHRFPAFSELEGTKIWEYDDDELVEGRLTKDPKAIRYHWNVNVPHLFDGRQEITLLQTMVIGKTGYGKSSMLNQIIGKAAFPIDDVSACTSEIDAALFRLGKSPEYYFGLSDLPGVGESQEADSRYMKLYRSLLPFASCVVYVLRADQRDYTIDERTFRELFTSEDDREKVLIALNQADKIEPTSRTQKLSAKQLENLNEKADQISEQFSIDDWKVIPCCAKTGYGMDELVSEIVDCISSETCDED